MKAGIVPSSWLKFAGWNAAHNLALLEEVDKRGIEHTDLDAVRAVWEELHPEVEPSKFKLEITLGNDAMQSYDDIRDALGRVTKGRVTPMVGDVGTIQDINGNKVGEWRVV